MISSINPFSVVRCEMGQSDSLSSESTVNGLTLAISSNGDDVGSNFRGERAVFHGARCNTSGVIETTSNYCMYGLNNTTTQKRTKTVKLVLEYFTVDEEFFTPVIVKTITLNVPCGTLFKVRIPQSALTGTTPTNVRLGASSAPVQGTFPDGFIECSYQQL
jgi:hypothetical protein